MATENPQKFRLNFLKMLLIRRRKQVPLTVELSKPVTNPRYQGVPPTRSSEAMEWCPKRDGYVKDDFAEENLYLYTEACVHGLQLPQILVMQDFDGP
ncbi:uncharacterized protein LOC18425591 isoform X4 [Amborella trichopoda]|uniref:uncharacterized protein LOC18425591 isoform X4 n=1 Tax=Amborella trichopoda TaxID=13333 RepID=UPI0009BCF185|nr:uncharacterized protein LOC18425591 isoform X4 [Amborella trichopoda]|eukprot:XP_020517755.1 uncharacterized protein LOC18425591 isoform X4 [Amborella trichopoda]